MQLTLKLILQTGHLLTLRVAIAAIRRLNIHLPRHLLLIRTRALDALLRQQAYPNY